MLKIKKREKKISDISPFTENEEFYSVDLREYVTESMVEKVYLSKPLILGIFDWTANSLNTETAVPEVGGYVLGLVYEHPGQDIFDIVLQYFCPANEVLFQSPVQLVLGSGANIQLERMMSRHPETSLMGWFHTHPGHTPYLSQTDLVKTHNLFYTKPYQIAIVLDSLTDNFDTGLFSWKKESHINNKADFSDWINWKELTVWAKGESIS